MSLQFGEFSGRYLRVVSWNVNSIKMRIDAVTALIDNEKPDVILLQETKCSNKDFPYSAFEDKGFNVFANGQKTYNGVVVASKFEIEDKVYSLEGVNDEATEATDFTGHSNDLKNTGEDLFSAELGEARTPEPRNGAGDWREARFAECILDIGGALSSLRVASVYVPNGAPGSKQGKVDDVRMSDRFKYKIAFLHAIARRLEKFRDNREAILYGGDFNVAPGDLDVYSVKNWEGQLSFLPEEKDAFHFILNQGYFDIMRVMRPDESFFTWYDYRRNSFNQGKGIRIDEMITSPVIVDRVVSSRVLDAYRGMEKPSDHVPIELVVAN